MAKNRLGFWEIQMTWVPNVNNAADDLKENLPFFGIKSEGGWKFYLAMHMLNKGYDLMMTPKKGLMKRIDSQYSYKPSEAIPGKLDDLESQAIIEDKENLIHVTERKNVGLGDYSDAEAICRVAVTRIPELAREIRVYLSKNLTPEEPPEKIRQELERLSLERPGEMIWLKGYGNKIAQEAMNEEMKDYLSNDWEGFQRLASINFSSIFRRIIMERLESTGKDGFSMPQVNNLTNLVKSLEAK